MAITKPGSPGSFADTLARDLDQSENLDVLQPFYSAIAFATSDALPTIPVAEFCKKLKDVCTEKKIAPAVLTKHFLNLIAAMKKLIHFQQHNNAPAEPGPPEDYFRVVTLVRFGSIPDDYVQQYLPLLEEVLNVYHQLIMMGIYFKGAMKDLGLERIIFSTLLQEGKTPDDPDCPYKLQLSDIILAQKYFEGGDLRGAISHFDRYTRGGMFPRDKERIEQFADNADPKYGPLLSFIIDIWERSPGVEPQPAVFTQDTPLPILLDQIVRPNTNFTAACRAFCEVATSENVATFFKTIFPNPAAFKKPQNLFALQTIINTIGPAQFNEFFGEFIFLPFILKLDLESMEKAMIESPGVKKFFEAARFGINVCDYSVENTRDIFQTLYQSLRAQTTTFPELAEDEFVDRIYQLCKAHNAPPIKVSAYLRELAQRVVEFGEVATPESGPYFDFDNADQPALQGYLLALTRIAAEAWGLVSLVGTWQEYADSLGLIEMLAPTDIFDPDKQLSTFQPIHLATAHVAMMSGLPSQAYDNIANYAGNLNAYDYLHLEKLAQYAPASYTPLISRLLFFATHPKYKKGEVVGSKEDYEGIGPTVNAITKIRTTRLNGLSTSREELKTLVGSRPFHPALFKNDLAVPFYLLLGTVASDPASNPHSAFARIKLTIIETLYVFLVERYLGHYQGELTDELAIEIGEAISLVTRQFFPAQEAAQHSSFIYDALDRKFRYQLGVGIPPVAPGYKAAQVYLDINDVSTLQRETKLEPSPARQRRMTNDNLAVFRKTPAGRVSAFSSNMVDTSARLQMVTAAEGVDELLAMYNSLYGGNAGQIDGAGALRARILDRIKTFPGYLFRLLSVANFLQDGIQDYNNSPLLYRSAPASLLIRLFSQAQHRDSCFRELFNEIKSPNVHTYYNACVLLGLLFQHDVAHHSAYLECLMVEVFNSAAAFHDAKNHLFLFDLFDHCDNASQVIIAGILARLPHAQHIDLTRYGIDFEHYITQSKVKNGKKVKSQNADPASPPADPYAGVQFLRAYPDIGLTKERNLEELSGEIIAHRSIGLPEQGAQLSTAFADSPLREVFPQAIVKADKATVPGPKSLRVLVNLEGKDKIKLFCRVLDNGELQVRILKSGQDGELITAAQAEAKGISAKVFTELNYFVLEILRCIYVKTEPAPSAPPSDPPPLDPPVPESADVSPSQDGILSESIPTPPVDTTAPESTDPEAPAEPALIPPPPEAPAPIAEPEPQTLSARHRGAMSIFLGKRAQQEKDAKAKIERKGINENLRLVRDLFMPLFKGEEVTDFPSQLGQVELYIAEQMEGQRGQPIDEIFYSRVTDPYSIFEGLQDGIIQWDQICVRKARLHAQPLPYLVDIPKRPLPDGTQPRLYQLKKSAQTGIAAQRYEMAKAEGQSEVEQGAVQSVLRMKVADTPTSRRLMEQVQDPAFIKALTAARIKEIRAAVTEEETRYKIAAQSARAAFFPGPNSDAQEVEAYLDIMQELESTHLSIMAALEAEALAPTLAATEDIEVMPEHAGAKDGQVSLPQPGYFEFNQTFNQGSFISLQDLMSSQA